VGGVADRLRGGVNMIAPRRAVKRRPGLLSLRQQLRRRSSWDHDSLFWATGATRHSIGQLAGGRSRRRSEMARKNSRGVAPRNMPVPVVNANVRVDVSHQMKQMKEAASDHQFKGRLN
jgi:hypothetical protein